MYKRPRKRRRRVFQLFTLQETCLVQIGVKPKESLTPATLRRANDLVAAIRLYDRVTFPGDRVRALKMEVTSTLLAPGRSLFIFH